MTIIDPGSYSLKNLAELQEVHGEELGLQRCGKRQDAKDFRQARPDGIHVALVVDECSHQHLEII